MCCYYMYSYSKSFKCTMSACSCTSTFIVCPFLTLWHAQWYCRNLILWDTLMPTNRGIVRGKGNALPAAYMYIVHVHLHATLSYQCETPRGSSLLKNSPPLSPPRLHLSWGRGHVARLLQVETETVLWRKKGRGVCLWHPTVLSPPVPPCAQLSSQLYSHEWHWWIHRDWVSRWRD